MINVHLVNKDDKKVIKAVNEQERMFMEQQQFRKKDIEMDIKFGFDRKKKRHHASDSTESSSETLREVLEKFDNDGINARSPTENPVPNPKNIEFEELEQELGARNVYRPSTYRQLSLLLSCVTLLKNNLVFIDCFFKYGGGWFMIPYLISLFAFAVPVAIFELSMAQFTSLPMFGFFSRMAPILGGIPYMIIFIRIFYAVVIVFDPRFFTFMLVSLNSALQNSYVWTQCQFYPGVACHDPKLHCEPGQYIINGTCESMAGLDFLADQPEYIVVSHFARRESRTLSLTPAQIYSDLLSFDMPTSLISAFLFLTISGYISYKGQRFFAAFASFFVFLPVIGIIPAVVSVYYEFGSSKQSLFKQLVEHNDISKLFMLDAWIQAARLCVKTLYIGDGTLLTLGSMADFRHNFVKDALLLASTGALYRIVLCLSLLPIIHVGNSIINPFEKTLNTDDGLLPFRSADYFFSALPSFQTPALTTQTTFLLYALFFFCFNIAFIAYQVITFEMIIGWAHHVFPQLLYLKQKTIRLCVVLGSGSLLMILHVAVIKMRSTSIGYSMEVSIDKYSVGLMSTVVLIELFAVGYVYGFERLLINTLTMVKYHKKTHKIIDSSRMFLYIIWTIALPLMCLMTIHRLIKMKFDIYNLELFSYVFVSVFPFLYALRKVVQSLISGEPVSWLGQTSKFEPANVGHARDAEYEERAAAVVH